MPNLSVARNLAALATGFIAGQFLLRVIEKKRSAYSGIDNTDTEQSDSDAPFIKTEDKPRFPTQEEHRSAEQAYWNRSIVATWVAVLVAAGAAIFSFLAFQETRRQADAAEENNRPWLSVSGLTIDSLTISDDDIRIDATISFSNVGHSPATNVAWSMVSVISDDNKSGFRSGREICRGTKGILGVDESESVVFPDSGIQKRGVVAINKLNELVSENERFLSEQLKIINQNRKGRKIPEKMAASLMKQSIFLKIRGCFVYQTSWYNNQTYHATSFAYNLFVPASGGGFVGLDVSSPRTLTNKDLVVAPTIDGIFAD